MSSSFHACITLVALCGTLHGATTVFDYIPLSVDEKPAPLSAYKGKVLLIVNVASHSEFTPQYQGLESLYEKYKGRGLVVLAFPANDFGQEEPDGNAAIKQFAVEKYKVTFPLFAKVSIAGDSVSPLYQLLSDKEANASMGGPIRWNFTKFLIARDGKILNRFEPNVEPEAPEIISAIEKALAADPSSPAPPPATGLKKAD